MIGFLMLGAVLIYCIMIVDEERWIEKTEKYLQEYNVEDLF